MVFDLICHDAAMLQIFNNIIKRSHSSHPLGTKSPKDGFVWAEESFGAFKNNVK